MTDPIVSARMPKQDPELIRKIAKARGEDVGGFVRRAIYRELARPNFLSQEQKKAVEMHET